MNGKVATYASELVRFSLAGKVGLAGHAQKKAYERS